MQSLDYQTGAKRVRVMPAELALGYDPVWIYIVGVEGLENGALSNYLYSCFSEVAVDITLSASKQLAVVSVRESRATTFMEKLKQFNRVRLVG